jgi:hypothetical protein
MLEPPIQDLRFAVRSARRHPVPAAAAVACLALGIGANASLFGAVDFFLLRPLPVREPDRLVRVLQLALGRGAVRAGTQPSEQPEGRWSGSRSHPRAPWKVGRSARGAQTSWARASVVPRKPGAATPTISNGTPPRRTVLPTAEGSLAKRRC